MFMKRGSSLYHNLFGNAVIRIPQLLGAEMIFTITHFANKECWDISWDAVLFVHESHSQTVYFL